MRHLITDPWKAVGCLLGLLVTFGCGQMVGSPSGNGPSSAPPPQADRPADNATPSSTDAPPEARSPNDGSPIDGSTKQADGPENPPASSDSIDKAPAPTSLATRKKGVDWPRFLGPTADSKSPETGLLTSWPKEGPRVVWQRESGEGYGMGTISQGRYFHFERVDDEARVVCLNAETGKELWTFDYPSEYEDLYGYSGGPRCSPIVDEDRLYVLGAEGMLYCLAVATGKPLWEVDTSKKFGVVQNFFGVGSTPVIDGNLLICIIGGSPPDSQLVAPGQLDRVVGNGSGVVAFDKWTGKVIYKLSDELASYAAPKLATIDGQRWCFAFAREGLLGFDPQVGKERFHFPWRARILESVNASTPVVVGDQVLISETYGPGAAMLAIENNQAAIVWKDDDRKREKILQAHWNTPIHVDGYLYGCSGRHTENADLRCIEWKTGRVMWTEPDTSRTSLTYVDGHFLSLGEYGELRLIKVNSQKYDEVARVVPRDTQVPAGFEPVPLLKYPCWAAPVISHGLLYLRGKDRIVCMEVIEDTR